jgi:EF hand
MRKHVFALTASAIVFIFGVSGHPVQAQAPAAQNSPSQERATGTKDLGSMMGPRGMMGDGMMRGGMMGREGMMGHGRTVGMAPMMMRMMFALMDADGDGKISLQEFQAAHERIFKAMDANKDGFVTLDEMQAFIRGTSTSAVQQ